MSCSESKNPLQRGGTSQQQRLLAATQPGYVQIDEREFVDWIDFASRFAGYLNYYSAANIVTGNWQPFFDNDISAVLGTIAIQDIDAYRRGIKDRFDLLKSDEHQNDTNLLKGTLGELFSAVLTLSISLDSYLFRLPDDISLKSTIRNLVKLKLQPALQKLLSYYKGGKSNKKTQGGTDNGLIIVQDNDVPGWTVLNRQVMNTLTTLETHTLSADWINGKATLWDFYESVTADKSIYGDDDWTPYERINHAANHNLFAGLFDQFLSTYARLIKDAEAALIQSLTNYNTHPPHYTLFLTFLQLFKYAQADLNTITQRHLDFYYKDVLQMRPRTAIPNHAHLIMELSRNTNKHLMKAGTLFKAGKDSAGREVNYVLNRDTLFNKGLVTQLRSVYLGETDADNISKDAVTVINKDRLFASMVSNSADGMGAALTSTRKEWHPFAARTLTNGKVSSINMPRADIGFAIASPYLFMGEGERTVKIRMVLKVSDKIIPDQLKVTGYVTTPKEWYKVALTGYPETGDSEKQIAITFKFTLTGAEPAITDFNPKVHSGTYQAGIPVLKILLQNEHTGPYEYLALKDILVRKINMTVFAGVGENYALKDDGVKKLNLYNDLGALDGSKAFQPFGNMPKAGASFILGNEELFKKPGAYFQLRMKWLELPDKGKDLTFPKDTVNGKSPAVRLDLLERGSWSSSIAQTYIIDSTADTVTAEKKFPGTAIPVYTNLSVLDDSCYVPYEEPYEPYSINSKKGYMKFTLLKGFGQEEYQRALIEFLSTKAYYYADPKPADPGVAPYTPKLQSLTLHYYAEAKADFTITDEQLRKKQALSFMHIHPFGELPFDAYTNSGPVNMFPQFYRTENNQNIPNIAEFYIGIEQLQPNDSVNILFQVLEGTMNPLTIKPPQHITWSYLSNNSWKPFDRQSVTDNTSQLVQSGIISFILPADATTVHTLLPTGYIWLRASVSEAVQAVCKLLSVQAQAATVTLIDKGIAPDFMNVPLPAETISKMVHPVAAIKKLTQPYTSFGGRGSEEYQHYYTRVSERLRHKDRAITIWDYERLLLEAFPELHRVKCLNHTRFDKDDPYNEVAPGNVTIITIPNLTNRNDADPLRPYTDESTLVKIREFLAKRTSCHVTTHVRHPLFEEVTMDFKLKLLPGYEYNYYSKMLKEEITAFLTPWAYGRSEEVQFGGRVNKSVMINFIEERPYVDYITEVKMYHQVEGQPPSVLDVDIAVSSTARSILISSPSANHIITEIVPEQQQAAAVPCVDEWNEKQGWQQEMKS